jgi:carboxylate-amine ligase
VFRAFPRTGVPRTIASWAAYQEYLDTLIATGCITDGSKIWWDLRPHHAFPTLEFRICDVCTRVEEAVCIAAILQTLVFKLWKMRQDNITFRVYSSDLIDENKWRAVRYGLDGKLIDFGKQCEAPARELIAEFIEWFLGDAMDELGTRKDVEYAFTILREGSSADRQLKVYRETGGDLKAVVDHLIRETEEGVR